ncbi:hypothetical protein AV530_016788 [Patagioenas fasciata monilis]|uniref:Uncharacterized protein n=1 Tax=Patagioenas fasciata monilis TaxID=372326 RepID=A0A1V4J472_PATFA|nr:hypothetical protein AV530_016788 [Patagioenas fasciata monilis]
MNSYVLRQVSLRLKLDVWGECYRKTPEKTMFHLSSENMYYDPTLGSSHDLTNEETDFGDGPRQTHKGVSDVFVL